MITKRLQACLDKNHIQYHSVHHGATYTAIDTANAAHIARKDMAKCVMVKIDGKLGMVVLPANRYLDFAALKKIAGTDNVELAYEREFEHCFPDCELGAMPPFGNLYDMEVYADISLEDDKEISCNAGDHLETISIPFEAYKQVVKPIVGKLAA